MSTFFVLPLPPPHLFYLTRRIALARVNSLVKNYLYCRFTQTMSECEYYISYDSSVEVPSTCEEQRPIAKRAILPSCPDPCKVCGGESTGYHYQVSSCNGCKSFFRRTITGNRIFECLFDNDCLIPKQIHKKQKRRKCRACRFRRCVEVGMNPLGIVIDADENNVLPTKISTKRLVSIEDVMESSLKDLLYSENRLILLRKSVHNFRPDCGFTIESLLNQFTPMGSSFPEMPPLSNWRMNLMNIEFHIENILPLPTIDYSHYPSSFKFWFYMDLVYQMAWISSFDFFKSLDRPDQIEITKIVTLQLGIFTVSYFSYCNKSSSCMFPDGSFFVWTTDKMFDVIRNCYEIQLIDGEYALLKILLLCNPTWDRLSPSARSILSAVQKKYTTLLLELCIRNHDASGGPARMATLLQLQNTIIHKAAKVRSRIELMTILKIRSCRETLVDQICDVENL